MRLVVVCFGGIVKRFTKLLTLIAALAMGSFAQDNAGNIGGTVLDASGSTVVNAKVTVTNTDRNQVMRTLTTDATGSYSALILPVGTYSIKVEATGFKTEDRTGIALNVSDVVAARGMTKSYSHYGICQARLHEREPA